MCAGGTGTASIDRDSFPGRIKGTICPYCPEGIPPVGSYEVARPILNDYISPARVSLLRPAVSEGSKSPISGVAAGRNHQPCR